MLNLLKFRNESSARYMRYLASTLIFAAIFPIRRLTWSNGEDGTGLIEWSLGLFQPLLTARREGEGPLTSVAWGAYSLELSLFSVSGMLLSLGVVMLLVTFAERGSSASAAD